MDDKYKYPLIDLGDQVDDLRELVECGPVCLVGLPASGKHTSLRQVVGERLQPNEVNDIDLGGTEDQIKAFVEHTDQPGHFLLRNVHSLPEYFRKQFFQALAVRKRHDGQVLAMTSRWPLDILLGSWGIDLEKSEGVETAYLQPVSDSAIAAALGNKFALAGDVYNRTGGVMPFVGIICKAIRDGAETVEEAEENAKKDLERWFLSLKRCFSGFRYRKEMTSYCEILHGREMPNYKQPHPECRDHFQKLGLGDTKLPEVMGVLHDLVMRDISPIREASCCGIGCPLDCPLGREECLMTADEHREKKRRAGGQSSKKCGAVEGSDNRIWLASKEDNKVQIIKVNFASDFVKKIRGTVIDIKKGVHEYKITSETAWEVIDSLLDVIIKGRKAEGCPWVLWKGEWDQEGPSRVFRGTPSLMKFYHECIIYDNNHIRLDSRIWGKP